MASVTIIFRKDKLNKKGEAPIHFRIIKSRRVSYLSSGKMIPEKYWDEKKCRVKAGYRNSGRMNSYLINKFSEIQDSLLEQETFSKTVSTKNLREKIHGKAPADFVEFADKVLERYKIEKKFGTYYKNGSVLAKLKEYMGEKKLSFEQITPSFLITYEGYLRTKHCNKTNTVDKDMKFIRKVFNDAIREDVIDYGASPFGKYKSKTEKTHREHLTEEELTLIENYQAGPGSKMELHRNMFVFACYSGGIRISDLLKFRWKDFDGTHLTWVIKKTGVQMSIKVPNKGLAILEKYKTGGLSPNCFIFPILPKNINLMDAEALDNAISGATAYINKNLKIMAEKVGIQKNISFHVSRHTFAVMALRKGISIDKVSKLMAHSAIRETQIYAKIVNEDLDKAMDNFNK